MCVDSFVQHNAIACAYLAFLTDTVNTPQTASIPSPVSMPSSSSLLTLQQQLNAPTGKTKVPAVYKTCLTECLLGTTELDAVLIGLSDLYEQVVAQQLLLESSALQVCSSKEVRLSWSICDAAARESRAQFCSPALTTPFQSTYLLATAILYS